MENVYNRTRKMSPETKQKISQALTNRPKSPKHKQHISDTMKNLWSTVPPREDGGDNGASWDNVM